MSTMCNYLTPIKAANQMSSKQRREGVGWWKYNCFISTNTTSLTTRTTEKYIFSFTTHDAALCHCSTMTLERKGTGITAVSVCVFSFACMRRCECENIVLTTNLSHIIESRERSSSGLSGKIQLTTKGGLGEARWSRIFSSFFFHNRRQYKVQVQTKKNQYQ